MSRYQSKAKLSCKYLFAYPWFTSLPIYQSTYLPTYLHWSRNQGTCHDENHFLLALPQWHHTEYDRTHDPSIRISLVRKKLINQTIYPLSHALFHRSFRLFIYLPIRFPLSNQSTYPCDHLWIHQFLYLPTPFLTRQITRRRPPIRRTRVMLCSPPLIGIGHFPFSLPIYLPPYLSDHTSSSMVRGTRVMVRSSHLKGI